MKPFKHYPSAGFSLIELMIVVAIIAIIAAVAYPSYQNSIIKGKRAQGRTGLINLMQQQERYLTQSGSYMTFGQGATGTNGTTQTSSGVQIPFVTTSGDNPAQAAYTLAATTCPITPVPGRNECVMLQAIPNGWTDSSCGTLQLQSTGIKTYTGTGTSGCW